VVSGLTQGSAANASTLRVRQLRTKQTLNSECTVVRSPSRRRQMNDPTTSGIDAKAIRSV